MIIESPKITYHVNTFNRRHLLRNMLLSFCLCNKYDNFEWIIVDYGSNDGTRDFILSINNDPLFSVLHGKTIVSFLSEDNYFNNLKKIGRFPKTKRKRMHSIFGKYRNYARSIAAGDYFIDIADDHQFFVSGNWVADMFDIYKSRHRKMGVDDISTILYRGLPLHRIMKPNNSTLPVDITESGISYYVAKHKSYDDYHIMKRDTYNKVGPYYDIENDIDNIRVQKFCDGEDNINHYDDYLERTKVLGMKKIFMKIPYVVDFPNGLNDRIVHDLRRLIVPIVKKEYIARMFHDIDRPISSDEIFNLLKVRI